jgi:hypothetical protein
VSSGWTNHTPTLLPKEKAQQNTGNQVFPAENPVFIDLESILLAFTAFGDKIELEFP